MVISIGHCKYGKLPIRAHYKGIVQSHVHVFNNASFTQYMSIFQSPRVGLIKQTQAENLTSWGLGINWSVMANEECGGPAVHSSWHATNWTSTTYCDQSSLYLILIHRAQGVTDILHLFTEAHYSKSLLIHI